MQQVHTGKVVNWVPGRGFGFIEDDADKQQLFVHYSSLQVAPGAFRSLVSGQDVQYDVSMQEGRPRAENVTQVGGGLLPPGPRPEGDFNNRGRGGPGGYRGGGRGFGGGFNPRGDGGFRGRGNFGGNPGFGGPGFNNGPAPGFGAPAGFPPSFVVANPGFEQQPPQHY